MSQIPEKLKPSKTQQEVRKLRVRMLPFTGVIPTAEIAQWNDLERRSLLANPFLSSAFLLSQPKQRLRESELQLLAVERGTQWMAAGVFRKETGSRHLALPHLVALPILHVYKTGMLIDAEESQAVVSAIWNFLIEQGLHGIKFPLFPLASPLSFVLNGECDQRQIKPVVRDQFLRASVSRHEKDALAGVSPKRLKSLARGKRFLERDGDVSLVIAKGIDQGQHAIERFLRLESAGWKGQKDVALLSTAEEAHSFRQLASQLLKNDRIRFAELKAGQRVVASMCLFRSESDFYAFKIGWEPDFERGCPGFLLAHMLREQIKSIDDCERIDGCARQGSFLDHVWESRKEMGTIIFPTTRWGSITAQRSNEISRGIRLVRRLKKKLTRKSSLSGESR